MSETNGLEVGFGVWDISSLGFGASFGFRASDFDIVSRGRGRI
jgi:hypothetical protein